MIVKDILADNVVDFVVLQETMKKTYSDAFFRKIDPSKKYAWHWIPSEGKSGGILCGVNLEKFDVIHFSEGNFSLSATMQCKKEKKKLLLVSIYGLLMMRTRRNSLLNYLRFAIREAVLC